MSSDSPGARNGSYMLFLSLAVAWPPGLATLSDHLEQHQITLFSLPQPALASPAADTPGSMGQYQLSEEAVLLILLHAAKYPSCTVCGLLLGDPGSSTVKTAIPLFHLSMLLAPAVETALTQVSAYAAARGLAAVGYYHSEARFTATDLHPVGGRIAERLAERQPGAFVALLDNQKLAAFSREGSSECPLELLLRDAAGGPRAAWKRVAPGSGGLALAPGCSWEGLRARFLNLSAAGRAAELADFDEHLDDLAKDWSNPGLLGTDSQLLAK